MDSALYSDSYERYKAGTNYIASWLVETAKSCGTTLDFLDPGKLDPSIRVSNGSKNKKPKTNSGENVKNAPKSKVPVGEFVRLAKIIAAETKLKPELKIMVPRSVLQIGKEVISLRKRCSNFFSDQAHSDELFQEKNEGHLHFISVIEEVVTILDSCPSPSPSAQSKTKEGKPKLKNNKDVVNSFAALNFEETNLGFEEASIAARDSKTRAFETALAQKSLYEAEPEPSDNELLFSIFCFFGDLNEVRTFITETWIQFRDGEIDLATAAITTDISIDLIREKEKEFLEAITIPEELKGAWLGNILFFFTAMMRNEDPDARASQDDRLNVNLIELSNWLFVSPFTILEELKAMAEGKEAPTMEAISEKWGDDGPPIGIPGLRNKFMHEVYLMLNMFCDFYIVAMSGIILPAEDNITKGLRAYFLDLEKTSVWLVFALQTFIDVHDVLHKDTEIGFRTLCESGDQATAQLQEYFRFARTMPEGNTGWPHNANRTLLQVLKVITQFTKKDQVKECAMQIMGEHDQAPHSLLKNHPVLCGLLTFHIDLSMWEGGMQMANAWNSIFSWVHLYNAVKHEHGCEDWQDIEFLIGQHDPKHLFYGGRPTKSPDYDKRCTLAMGMSARLSATASSRRNARFVSGRGFDGAVRQLRLDSLVCEIFAGRYRTLGSVWDKEYDESPHVTTILAAFAKKPLQSSVTRRGRDPEGPMGVPLLEALRSGLAEECVPMHFDHFSLHERCWELLKSLREALSDDLALVGALTAKAHKELFDDDMNLQMLPGHVLSMLATYSGANRREATSQFMKAVTMRIMSKARTLLQELIKREGGVESAKAERARPRNSMKALTRDRGLGKAAGA